MPDAVTAFLITMWAVGMGVVLADLLLRRQHSAVACMWQAIRAVMQAIIAAPGAALERRKGHSHTRACSESFYGCTLKEPPVVHCTCGSKSDAVPVEVTIPGDTAPTVVNHLCPDCGEKRTPKQLRTQDYHQHTGAWPAKATDRDEETAVILSGVTDDGDYLDLDRLPLSVVRAITARMIAATGDDLGAGAYLTARTRFEDRTKAMNPEPHWSTVPGSVAPQIVEIEQGGYIYALGLHVPIESLCEDDEHEWERLDVHAYGSNVPIRNYESGLCLRCEVRRRPAPPRADKPLPLLVPLSRLPGGVVSLFPPAPEPPQIAGVLNTGTLSLNAAAAIRDAYGQRRSSRSPGAG